MTYKRFVVSVEPTLPTTRTVLGLIDLDESLGELRTDGRVSDPSFYEHLRRRFNVRSDDVIYLSTFEGDSACA